MDTVYSNNDLSKKYIAIKIASNSFYKDVMEKLVSSAEQGKLKTDLIEWPKDKFDRTQFYEIFVKCLGYSIYLDIFNYNITLSRFKILDPKEVPGFYMKINL